MSESVNNLYIWLLVNFKESLIVSISNNDDFPPEGLLVTNAGIPSGKVQESICFKHIIELDDLDVTLETLYSIEFDETSHELKLIGDNDFIYSEILPLSDYLFNAQNYYTKGQVEELISNEIAHQIEKIAV